MSQGYQKRQGNGSQYADKKKSNASDGTKNKFVSNNMNYIFNEEYFAELKISRDKELKFTIGQNEKESQEKLEKRNKWLQNFCFTEEMPVQEWKKVEGYQDFVLSSIYPGIMIGTGNPHDIKMEGAIKCGFTFDYVTGLPYLPGSSLKGMLRSCFPGTHVEDKQEYAEYIRGILNKDKTFDVLALEENIFEYNDIFLGAVPVIQDIKHGEKLLEMEYITPHKDKFKNPIPINMLKVKPGVAFTFCYILHDYKDEQSGTVIISTEEKLNLFRQLVLDMGIGAKTNVGFGQLEEKHNDEQINAEKINLEKKNVERISVEKGKEYVGKITKLEGKKKVKYKLEDGITRTVQRESFDSETKWDHVDSCLKDKQDVSFKFVCEEVKTDDNGKTDIKFNDAKLL